MVALTGSGWLARASCSISRSALDCLNAFPTFHSYENEALIMRQLLLLAIVGGVVLNRSCPARAQQNDITCTGKFIVFHHQVPPQLAPFFDPAALIFAGPYSCVIARTELNSTNCDGVVRENLSGRRHLQPKGRRDVYDAKTVKRCVVMYASLGIGSAQLRLCCYLALSSAACLALSHRADIAEGRSWVKGGCGPQAGWHSRSTPSSGNTGAFRHLRFVREEPDFRRD